MARSRVVLNDAAIAALKRHPAVIAMLREKVDKVTTAANEPGQATGDGFVGGVDITAKGARGWVTTKNQHGMYAEAKDRRLTRALEAGR